MSTLLLIATIYCAILIVVTNSQRIRMCTCREFEPCRQLYHSAFWPCIDACEPQLARLGANFNMLRACVTDRHNQIVYTEDCIERSWGNVLVYIFIFIKKLEKIIAIV